jgi:uncharacterized protein (TIGR02145 family)
MSKTVSKFTLAAGIMLAMAFTLSCSIVENGDGSSSSSGGGGFSSSGGGGTNPSSSSNGGGGGGSSCPVSAVSNNSVTCGGQTYRTVQIGNQKWFAENLNYNASGSRCYDDDPANCTKYGRLYYWNTAKTVCPNGWHLPSKDEWDVLMTAVGGSSTAGTKLKVTNGWYDCGPSGSSEYNLCEDSFGFSALPGGEGYSDGYGLSDDSFSSVGSYGFWWSASVFGETSSVAYYCHMRYFNEHVSWVIEGGRNLLSVRCLQD